MHRMKIFEQTQDFSDFNVSKMLLTSVESTPFDNVECVNEEMQ